MSDKKKFAVGYMPWNFATGFERSPFYKNKRDAEKQWVGFEILPVTVTVDSQTESGASSPKAEG